MTKQTKIKKPVKIKAAAKPKTRSASTRKSSTLTAAGDKYDGIFALKLAVYVVLGSIWIKFTNGQVVTIPIPIGLILGIIFTSKERFKTDRKIEYAVLMIAALVGWIASFGIYVTI